MMPSGAEKSASEKSAREERALLDATRRRDRQAFTELYHRYQPRLYGYLYRFLGNPALAEEVLDDVMFVVWQDARRFRGDSRVSSWIFGIAYRKAMTAARKEGRHQAPVDRGVDADALPAARPRDVDLMQVALSHLSADHRQVVELSYFCGFSYQEIAEIADCPVNTVKTRMFHARRRLRVMAPVLAGSKKEQDREQR